jgi:hypothetical protein
MSEKEKEKYVTLQEKDRQRYNQQMKMFKELGFFILEDGTNSKDLEPLKFRIQR